MERPASAGKITHRNHAVADAPLALRASRSFAPAAPSGVARTNYSKKTVFLCLCLRRQLLAIDDHARGEKRRKRCALLTKNGAVSGPERPRLTVEAASPTPIAFQIVLVNYERMLKNETVVHRGSVDRTRCGASISCSMPAPMVSSSSASR
jgi:hypothetical protein